MIELVVLVGTVAITVAAGLMWRARQGALRGARDLPIDLPPAVRELLDPASRITLVQISTTFCASCRRTRALLTDLAGRTVGLVHVEIDVTDRPEIATRLRVMSTPTTLAINPRGNARGGARGGTEVLRFSGVPRRDELLAALRGHLAG